MRPRPVSRLPRPPRRPDRRAQGQSLVEFCLMLVFLLVVLMGVLDLGRAYFTYLAVKDAASEGAYFGSAFPQCIDESVALFNPGCAGGNNIDFRVRNTAPDGGLVEWDDALVITTHQSPSLEAGQALTVSVSYQYQMITPFVSAIAANGTLTLTARSSAIIVRVPDCTHATGCE